MKIRAPAARPPRIEMIPLIDVVFLLLVVFIYAMLSMAVHKGLPVALPTSSTVQTDRQTLLSISVKAGGDIFVDEAPVALADLGTVLRRRAEIDQETGVLLFADRDLSYQALFRVLDQVRQAGLTRISLQAEGGPTP
jgi:biopolymer transport protein ExbD